MLAWALGAIAVLEIVVAAVVGAVSGMSFHTAVDSFVITHGAVGLTFRCAECCWHGIGRPTDRLAVLAAGIRHATAAVAYR